MARGFKGAGCFLEGTNKNLQLKHPFGFFYGFFEFFYGFIPLKLWFSYGFPMVLPDFFNKSMPPKSGQGDANIKPKAFSDRKAEPQRREGSGKDEGEGQWKEEYQDTQRNAFWRFCYIKPTKKHSFGCLGGFCWVSLGLPLGVSLGFCWISLWFPFGFFLLYFVVFFLCLVWLRFYSVFFVLFPGVLGLFVSFVITFGLFHFGVLFAYVFYSLSFFVVHKQLHSGRCPL